MPLFYQQDINAATKLGVWHIAEGEDFFLREVPLQRGITHPHKRLQHLAGRWLLRHLFPGFPYELIRIADTRKPFLLDEAYHFSISHCGDYAAAIVSREHRVGVDIEIPQPKITRVANKFLSETELASLPENTALAYLIPQLTVLWSAKEAVFKWFGDGGVDFRQHIRLDTRHDAMNDGRIDCDFTRISHTRLVVQYRILEGLALAWVVG
jgi:phosphopantetheinyl transferase